MEGFEAADVTSARPERKVEPGTHGAAYMPPPIAQIFTHHMLAWLYENGYEDYEIYAEPSGLLTRTELSTIGIDKDTPERQRFETAMAQIRHAAMSLRP